MNLDQLSEYPILVVTGPESTGKTTLAEKIALESNRLLVPEYAREYLYPLKRKYDFFDLRKIAEVQNQNETQALKESKTIVCDTDLITIDIWALEKFDTSLNIDLPHADQKYYLLCKPDIAWEEDPLRENPLDRDRLFDVYEQYLRGINLPFAVVEGEGEERYCL